MFKKVLLVVMVVVMGVPSLGVAENDEYKWLTVPKNKSVGLIETVYLVIDDQVENGCWTNVQEVKNRFRYRLESEGISVSQDQYLLPTPKNPTIIFSVSGDKFQDRCTALCQFSVEAAGSSSTWNKKINVDISGALSLWVNLGSFISAVGGKLDGQLLKKADSLMDSFLADALSARKDQKVIKAKRQCFDKYSPLTVKEYEEWVKSRVER